MPLYKVVTRLQINDNNAQKRNILLFIKDSRKFLALHLKCGTSSEPCPGLGEHWCLLDLLVTFSFTSLGIMINGSRREPWRNRSWACLLSHAVVANHSVKSSPWVGILCRVVGIQWGRYASLMLIYKSIWAAVIICEGFVHHKKHYASKKRQCQAY